jgi:hypothetical protein
MSQTTRHTWFRLAAVPLLALILVGTTAVPPARADRYDDHYEERRHGSYNDEYLFAATRGVTGMEVPTVLKVPLVPIALVLDVVALPFEAIAGLF